MKKSRKLLKTSLIALFSLLFHVLPAQNTNTSVATAKLINSFPHTEFNVNSSDGGSAIGMIGGCPTIPCCSTLVYRIEIPLAGSLRVDFTNWTPLAGSLIAYEPNIENPTDYTHLTYISRRGNFCGFQDSTELGTGYTWYDVGSPDGNGYWDGSDRIEAGTYYVLFFNENQQSSIGIGNTTDLVFRFEAYCTENNVYYVDENASGTNDGSSFTNAFTSLHDALDIATGCDQLWLAKGTYVPTKEADGTTDSPRDYTYNIPAGLKVYGGFSGTETELIQRVNYASGEANETIINGDINGDDDGSINTTWDNTYAVVSSTSNLYDITITGSNPAKKSFVKEDASGSNDGSSWANAYNSLQSAIDLAASGDEIWVAKGTYKPSKETDGTTSNSRKFSFQMIDNVKIYGGFAGTESAISERTDYSYGGTNETILSGDHNNDDVISGSGPTLAITGNSENSYHVIDHPSGYSLSNTALLDGFTLKGGNANGSANPWNDAGAFYNQDGQSPTINNCYFIGNRASDNGGAYFGSTAADAILTNCTFALNYATDAGGAMGNYDSDPFITNCLFYGNRAKDEKGGAIYNYAASKPTITSSTITENSSVSGGGIYSVDNSDVLISNTIVYGNTITSGVGPQIRNYTNSNLTLSYSDIEGGIAGIYSTGGGSTIDNGANIDADPNFTVNVNADHPYAIAGNSPCADAGINNTNSETFDIRGMGFDRKLSKADGSAGTIDIGAYEYNSNSDWKIIPIFVDIDALGDNNGSSWEHAYTSLQSAMDAASAGDNIWVAAGVYHPSSAYDLTDTDRFYHFRMIEGVEIYGGFSGTETSASLRSNFSLGEANESILSADLNNDDVVTGSGSTLSISNNSENCYHVFYHPPGVNLSSNAILDGFTIMGANADGSYPHHQGGGMFNDSSSPNISNCILTSNNAYDGGGMWNRSSSPSISNSTISRNLTSNLYGGGIYNQDLSNVILTNCIISGNSSELGGGMSNADSSPLITNCTFEDNAASSQGGAIFNGSSSPLITNSIFLTNSTSGGGGAISNSSSSPTITNCTLSQNTAEKGGGIYNFGFGYSPIIINTILWDNTATSNSSKNEVSNVNSNGPTFSYCNIKGSGGDGVNNIDADPMFVGIGDYPYAIQGISPCADAGDNTANSETYDIRCEGFGRKLSKNNGAAGTIDIGAYEYLFGTDTEGTNPTTTWTGTAGDNDWSNTGNWDNGVPASNLNVVIPNGSNVEFSGAVASDNLEIEAGATLTISSTGSLTSDGDVIIKSNGSLSGSLIISGTYTGPDITYQRYMLANQWHLFGSPLTGQSIPSFLADTDNAIVKVGADYKMKHYIEGPTEGWSSDYTASTTGNIELGSAYVVKRSSHGLINLKGQPNNSSKDITLSRTSNGWNLISNPFTSAIAANDDGDAIHNLISTNLNVLDPSYASVYVWEENISSPTNTNNYRLINHADNDLNQDYLQVGQGFFVRSKAGGETFTITPVMQSHQTAIPFKTSTDWTSITLHASISNAKASTKISYRDDMTKGLDIGYDAGLLNSYPGFALYSHLVEDNGIDFGLQCVPNDFDNLVIPIGLDAQANEIVKFSIEASNLAENYVVVLEDRLLHTFTNLSEGEYSIQLNEDAAGVGRFYVHTVVQSALGFDDLSQDEAFQVFARANIDQLIIRGDVEANTRARIYSISGKLMADVSLKQMKENQISFNAETGVYLVQISNAEGVYTHKISWVK